MISKKISKIISASLIAVSLTLSSAPVSMAYASSTYGSERYYETKYDVSINKIWEIGFNKELEESTVSENNIKVYDYNSKSYMPVKVTLSANKQMINVELKMGTYNGVYYSGKYEYGGKYRLEIGSELTSKPKANAKAKKMLSSIKMDFVVGEKRLYAGLPAEEGLIITGNKAYSVGYLEKNSQLSNDLIKNGQYDVYYLYDKNGQKIRNLLGDDQPHSPLERSNQITYYSPTGKQSIYEWNAVAEEYKLIPASVWANITPGSDRKVVSVKVTEVKSVPNAMYFKLKHSNLVKKIGETVAFTSSLPTEEIAILSSNETVLAKGILSVDKEVSKYFSLSLVDETLGSTAGNINNNGSFVMDSDLYTYYRNTGDNNTMYRKDMTGAMEHQVSLDNAQYINALGQWIYYSNYSDNGKIYKMKKDGTNRTKVCDDTATYLIVSGNQIYYSNHSDKGKLYVINTDSTVGNSTKVVKDAAGLIHGIPVIGDYGNYDKAYDEVAYINLVGDWIYYSNISDKHKIYVVNKDGTSRRKVNDEWADCVQVVGDWVYYCSGAGVISKARKDGTGGIIPIRGVTREVDKGYHINVVEDWIYYSNSQDGGKLYKIKTDGSGTKYKLSDLKTDYINVIGDSIYIVTDSQRKTYMLPIDTDGTIQPKLITKNSLDSKIVKVNNIKKFVEYTDVTLPLKTLEGKYLPPKVPALMTDDTYKEVTVSWDVANVKYKDGVYTYTGTILGYGSKVILDLNIPSQMLNDTNKIIINNNGGANDTLEVIGTLTGNTNSVRLKAGDIISVYKEEECSTLLGKGTVGTDRKVLISKLKLDPYGESVYLTVKREGKGESKPTKVNQIEAPILDSSNVDDRDKEGLGIDGRDFSITKWVNSDFNKYETYDNYNIISQEIYILPSKTVLDMRIQKTVASSKDGYKGLTLASSSWTGTKSMNIHRDSKDVLFKDGMYDIYISSGFTGFAKPDSAGYKPLVEGNISTDAPGIMTVTGEKVPGEPSITTQRYKGGSTISLNLQLKEGEEVYLVPIEYSDRFIGWKKEDGLVDPFTDEYKANVISNGKGIEIAAPAGIDPRYLNYRDRAYKLFIKNSVGASNPSRGNIIVDNKSPEIIMDSLISLPYGATVRYSRITSANESTKDTIISPDTYTAYLITEAEFNNLSQYSSDLQLLNNKLKALVSSKDAAQSTGNTISTTTLKDVGRASAVSGNGFDNKNYILFTIDKSGNMSNVVPIAIWKDTNSLEDIMVKGNEILNIFNSISTPSTAVISNIKRLQTALTNAGKTIQNTASTQDKIDTEVINLLSVLKTVSDEPDKTYFADYYTLYNYYRGVNSNEKIKSNFSGMSGLASNSGTISITWPTGINELTRSGNNLTLTNPNDINKDTYVDYSPTISIAGIPGLTLTKPLIFTLKKSNPSLVSIELYGETGNEIYTNGGILQMIAKADVPSEIPYKDLVWKVTETNDSATDKATIDQYGMVKAIKNGTVKVTATLNSGQPNEQSFSQTINISEQKLLLSPTQITLQPYNSGGNVMYKLTITNVTFYKDADVEIRKASDNNKIEPLTLNTNIRNQIIINGLDIRDENNITIKLKAKPGADGEFLDSEIITVPVPR